MKNTSLKISAINAVVSSDNRNLLPKKSKLDIDQIIDKLDTLKNEEEDATKLIAKQNSEYNDITKEIENLLSTLGELPKIDLTIEEVKTLLEEIAKKRHKKAAELLEAKQKIEAPVLG